MRGTWPRPSSAISRSSHPSTFPSIDPSSTPSFTSSRPLPPTRSTRSSPSSTFRPAISSKPQPENPLSGFHTGNLVERLGDTVAQDRSLAGQALPPGIEEAPLIGQVLCQFGVGLRPFQQFGGEIDGAAAVALGQQEGFLGARQVDLGAQQLGERAVLRGVEPQQHVAGFDTLAVTD